ncbi:MAG: response regulator [Minwuia sp.]|nr:response regulator [Minwuia sp.]
MEDSKFFRSVLQRAVEVRTELTAVVASSMAEARQIVDREHEGFLLSLLDLNLPDAPQGEIVDYIQSRHIPAIVFTGKFDESVRESILAKNVIDYVIKVNQNSLDQVVGLISRFQKNRSVKVLVVEDSRSANEYVTRLLQTYGYIVLSAFDGQDALTTMKKNPDIAIVITDYNMPGMDGFELVSRLRESHSKDELAIIGLSGGGNPILSAKFLKIGANDFLNKPFLREEFYCRVNQNIEIIETFQNLKEFAMRDFLTGLYNRRFMIQSGTKMLELAKRQGHQVCAALMDLDYFKSINDTYGHDAGDLVIRNTAKRLEHFS